MSLSSSIIDEASFDAKAYIENVRFKNYNYDYSENTLSSCGHNYVFKPQNEASELIGSHHLYNTSCVNCSTESKAFFPNPLSSLVGDIRPCGHIKCSGK